MDSYEHDIGLADSSGHGADDKWEKLAETDQAVAVRRISYKHSADGEGEKLAWTSQSTHYALTPGHDKNPRRVKYLPCLAELEIGHCPQDFRTLGNK